MSLWKGFFKTSGWRPEHHGPDSTAVRSYARLTHYWLLLTALDGPIAPWIRQRAAIHEIGGFGATISITAETEPE